MKTKLMIAHLFVILNFMSTSAFSGNDDRQENTLHLNENGWSEIMEMAKSEGKPVFLAITASWCGPCKRLKRNTFTDSDVAAYYNETFINVVVDGEKGEGIQLARQYQVKGYPTLLYLDSDGQIIKRTSGYHKASDFIQAGKDALSKN